MTENANESPPIYCFFLLYCLNLIAQFDKLFLRTLQNSTPEDQKERKNVIFETPQTRERKKKKNRDSDTQESPKNETSRPIKNRASEISRSSQNFLRPTFDHSIPLLFCQREFKILLRRRQRERHSNNFAGTCSTVLVHLSSSLPTM